MQELWSGNYVYLGGSMLKLASFCVGIFNKHSARSDRNNYCASVVLVKDFAFQFSS